MLAARTIVLVLFIPLVVHPAYGLPTTSTSTSAADSPKSDTVDTTSNEDISPGNGWGWGSASSLLQKLQDELVVRASEENMARLTVAFDVASAALAGAAASNEEDVGGLLSGQVLDLMDLLSDAAQSWLTAQVISSVRSNASSTAAPSSTGTPESTVSDLLKSDAHGLGKWWQGFVTGLGTPGAVQAEDLAASSQLLEDRLTRAMGQSADELSSGRKHGKVLDLIRGALLQLLGHSHPKLEAGGQEVLRRVVDWKLNHPGPAVHNAERLLALLRIFQQNRAKGGGLGPIGAGRCAPYTFRPGAPGVLQEEFLGPSFFLTQTSGNCIIVPEIQGQGSTRFTMLNRRLACLGPTTQYLTMPAVYKSAGDLAEQFVCPQCASMAKFGQGLDVTVLGDTSKVIKFKNKADFLAALKTKTVFSFSEITTEKVMLELTAKLRRHQKLQEGWLSWPAATGSIADGLSGFAAQAAQKLFGDLPRQGRRMANAESKDADVPGMSGSAQRDGRPSHGQPPHTRDADMDIDRSNVSHEGDGGGVEDAGSTHGDDHGSAFNVHDLPSGHVDWTELAQGHRQWFLSNGGFDFNHYLKDLSDQIDKGDFKLRDNL